MHHVATVRAALVALLGLTAGGCADVFRQDQDKNAGQKDQPRSLVDLAEDFQLDQPADTWTLRTPQRWSIGHQGKRRFLQLAGPPPQPATPDQHHALELAVYNPYQFRSFNLSVRVRLDDSSSSTVGGPCIIFGRQDDTHFYQVNPFTAAHQADTALVRVEGQNRTSLVPPGRRPTPLAAGPDWHKLDLIRDVDAGTITVYLDAYDPQTKPWLEVKDLAYDWGHIALGASGGPASFAHLLISGQARPPGTKTSKATVASAKGHG